MDRADVGQVEEPPQQRRDDAGDGVGQEDRDAREAGRAHPRDVQQQREQQREAEHDGHHDAAVQQQPPEAGPQRGVAQRGAVVVEADERLDPATEGAADDPGATRAQDHRVDDRHEQEHHEQRGGRQQEQVGRDGCRRQPSAAARGLRARLRQRARGPRDRGGHGQPSPTS
jgi:hypothetical protein